MRPSSLHGDWACRSYDIAPRCLRASHLRHRLQKSRALRAASHRPHSIFVSIAHAQTPARINAAVICPWRLGDIIKTAIHRSVNGSEFQMYDQRYGLLQEMSSEPVFLIRAEILRSDIKHRLASLVPPGVHAIGCPCHCGKYTSCKLRI